MDSILAALGLQKGSAFASLAGALISYRFFRELKWPDRIMTALGGIACGLMVGPAISHLLDVTNEKVEFCIIFLTSTLGVSFLSAVVTAMPETIAAIRDYFLKRK